MKTVVVTGAGRGMGYEFARQHLQRGDRVYTLSRTVTDQLAALDDGSGRLVNLQCDIASTPSVNGACATILAGAGRLDVIYNNAATMPRQDRAEILDAGAGVDYYVDAFSVNAVGPFRVLLALRPFFREGLVILNVSSEGGSIHEQLLAPDTHNASYRASKAALNMLTVLLHNLVGKDGVRLFLLDPGWVRTDMSRGEVENAPDEVKADYARRSVSPEESVAHMIALALDPDSAPRHFYVSHRMKRMQW